MSPDSNTALPNDRRKRFLVYLFGVTAELFQISILSYLIFYLIETFLTGFVSDRLKLNVVLWVVLASGALTVVLQDRVPVPLEERRNQASRRRDWLFVAGTGLAAAGLLYLKLKDLGWLGLAVAFISGAIVVLVSRHFFSDFDVQKEDNKQ